MQIGQFNLKSSVVGVMLATGMAMSVHGELTPMDWAEGHLVVPAGSEVTVSGTEKWNTALTIHGTMNVDMESDSAKYYVVGGSSSAPANSVITLGGSPGDVAILNIKKGQMWGRYGNLMRSLLKFGTSADSGYAKLVIGPWYAHDEEFSQLQFQPGLKPEHPDDPVIDVLTLDRSAALWTYSLYQWNEKPVRITFTNSVGSATGGYRPILRGFYDGKIFFLPTPGGDIVLRGQGSYSAGVTNAPIFLAGHGVLTSSVFKRMFSTSASDLKACVRTEGDCDFVFDVGYNSSATPYFHELNATNFIWGHRRDFVIPDTGSSRAGLRTTVSRALPHGPQTGSVRVESLSSYTLKRFIDLYGTTQSINGLTLTGGAEILNLADTPAQLIFGEDDTSGTISAGAGVAETVSCRKIGSGTLTLSATTLKELVVEAGTLLVKGNCRVDRLVVPAGKISLDSLANLSCGTLVYTGRVDVANGAALTVDDRSGTAIEGYDARLGTQPKVMPFGYMNSFATLQEELCKNGSGLMSITMDNLSAGPLAVAEGTLRVVPPACSDEYWRFVFKKTSGTAVQYGTSAPYRKQDGATPVNVYLVLGKLHLLGPSGSIVNLNSSYKGTVADTALAAGGHAFTHAFFNTRNVQYGAGAEWNNGGYVALSMDSWWSATAFTNQALQVDNPSTWETVTFRLASGVRGVAGYMISLGSNAAWSYADPRTWTLESSADATSVAAGQWTVRDARADCVMAHYNTGTKDYFNDNKPFALNQAPASCPILTNAVSVASGATLDLAALGTEHLAISGLTVDLTAGAGTIDGFAAGANGVVDLRNLTDAQRAGSHLKSKIVLPLTLANIGSTANLASWKVMVDGELVPTSSVAFENGQIVVLSSVGTMILFR